MVYFDNAATSGEKPASVIRAVNFALKNYSANPGRSGHSAAERTANMVYKAREKTAEFFGADGPENVVFTMNCTHAANCVLKGVLKKGDHVIVSSLEHNAVMRPLVKSGVSYSVARVSLVDDEETVNNINREIRHNTKLVFCTGASNVLGKILPIEKIGRLCRENGIMFGIDAAQIAGVLPVDMKKMNIDFLCVAPHKGLYAPTGTGILIARKRIDNTIIEGGTGTNSLEMNQPENLPERLESGTLNIPGIAGVLAGIRFVEKMEIERIYNHELSLIARLYDDLAKIPEVTLYTPPPVKNSFVPLLPFNLKNVPSSAVATELSKNGIAVRGGFHCAPSAHYMMSTMDDGAVRVSTSVFNTERQIGYFLYVLKQKIIKNAKNS